MARQACPHGIAAPVPVPGKPMEVRIVVPQPDEECCRGLLRRRGMANKRVAQRAKLLDDVWRRNDKAEPKAGLERLGQARRIDHTALPVHAAKCRQGCIRLKISLVVVLDNKKSAAFRLLKQ